MTVYDAVSDHNTRFYQDSQGDDLRLKRAMCTDTVELDKDILRVCDGAFCKTVRLSRGS